MEYISEEKVIKGRKTLHILKLQDGNETVTVTHVPSENYFGAVREKADGQHSNESNAEGLYVAFSK